MLSLNAPKTVRPGILTTVVVIEGLDIILCALNLLAKVLHVTTVCHRLIQITAACLDPKYASIHPFSQSII